MTARLLGQTWRSIASYAGRRESSRHFHSGTEGGYEGISQHFQDTIETRTHKSTSPYFTGLAQRFHKNYPSLTQKEIEALQVSECRIVSESSAENLLSKELQAAQAQQADNRKIARMVETDSFFERFLNYLFMGPAIDYRTVDTSGYTNERLRIQAYKHDKTGTVGCSAQGRSTHMEDRHLSTTIPLLLHGRETEAIVTAVFDGHGGNECSDYLASHASQVLRTYLELNCEDGVSDATIYNALTLAVVHLSQFYQSNPNAGSTANITLQLDGRLWVANTGDSRAFVVDMSTGESTQLSVDAKPDHPRFLKEIVKRGGEVSQQPDDCPRVNGKLAIGATIGDLWADGIIPARPGITAVSLDDLSNKVIVQVSDGVTDVASTEEIGERLASKKASGMSLADCAEDIVKAAYVANSYDNMTALISTTRKSRVIENQ